MMCVKGVHRLGVAIVAGAISASAGSSIAAAQPSAPAVQVSGEFDALRLGELGETSTGVGVNVRWNLAPRLAIDGLVSYFPEGGETNTTTAFSQKLLLALGGLEPGITLGRVDLFGRARAGLLDFMKRGDPFPCLDTFIFPAPLECQLGGGYTALVFDLGGGADVALDAAGHLHLHADVGDLMVRYRLNAFRLNGSITDGFTGHNLLVTAGVGWRF
jgi:hypothetical protein